MTLGTVSFGHPASHARVNPRAWRIHGRYGFRHLDLRGFRVRVSQAENSTGVSNRIRGQSNWPAKCADTTLNLASTCFHDGHGTT